MVVSYMSMYANSAHSRRMQFRRSHTMVDYISEEDHENESEDANEESKLIHRLESPLLPRDNKMISQSPTNAEISPGNTPSNANSMRCSKRRASFQNRRSNTISWFTATAAPNHTNTESKESKRPGISTSQILTKMKARIRQKVFSSSEWPDAAALVQDKYRQRAIGAIDSLNSRIECSNSEYIQMQDFGFRDQTIPRSHRARHSLPTTSTQSLEVRSQANAKYLKRRSVSEGQVEHNQRMGRGIVCSYEDLRSIMWDYKKRRSVHFRKHLVDYTNIQNEKRDNQSSSDSNIRGQSSHLGSSKVNLIIGVDSDASSRATINLYPDVLVQSSQHSPESQNSTNLDADSNGNSDMGIVFEEPKASCEYNDTEFDPEILGCAIENYLDSMIQNKSVSECDSEDECKIISRSNSDVVLTKGDDIAKEESRDSVGFWTRLLCIFRSEDISD